jgi:hypothetical protein
MQILRELFLKKAKKTPHMENNASVPNKNTNFAQ